MFNDKFEIVVIRALAKRIKSPYSQPFQCVKTIEELDAAISAFNPRAYTDAASFAADYGLHTLLKKWTGALLPTADEATLDSWILAEEQCFRTNQRLNKISDFDLLGPFIDRVRELIVSVIGYVPSKHIFSQCRWSGGATFATKRGASPGFKSKLNKTITSSAVLTAPYLLSGLYRHADAEYQVVPGNKAVTVPKTYKIHRMIAIEPSANAFVQQSVGRYMRDSLRKVGINLDDQTANQDAAFRALIDDLATIDLSMASDTLATALVELLLPSEWFKLLNSLRSERTMLPNGTWRYLEKFSSMGNAFNFELETLIFWAVCKACSGGDVLVYGDDIVIRSSDYETVTKALEWCGFTVNMNKSFTKGSRFFESCGKHFFDLEDVTPVYQKDVVTKPIDFIRFHNRLFLWARRIKAPHLVKDVLKLIRDRSKIGDVVSPICDREVGFFDPSHPFRMTINGQIILEKALIRLQRQKPYDVDDFYPYVYKLMRPETLNSRPDGRTSLPSKGFSYTLRKGVRLWLSELSPHLSP